MYFRKMWEGSAVLWSRPRAWTNDENLDGGGGGGSVSRMRELGRGDDLPFEREGVCHDGLVV